jgi:hypothetical protein
MMKLPKFGRNATIIVALFVVGAFVFAYFRVQHKLDMAKEANLREVFPNVSTKVTTTWAPLSSDKPYSEITIEIPSLASKYDDSATDSDKDKLNKVIDRVAFGTEFKEWLRKVYNGKAAAKYTDKIVVKYRDDVVISKDYTEKSWYSELLK